MFTNVVIDNWKQGFNVEHDETIANVTSGSLKATEVLFGADVPTKTKGTATAVPPATSGASADVAAVVTESAAATGAGNGADTPTWAAGWTTGL